MTSHDFFFALEFSSQGAPALLVEDLARQVFRYVGCSEAAVPGLSDALEEAVAKGAAGGHKRCDVQFRAQNGALEVLVAANGGRVWQMSLAMPKSDL